MTAGSLNQAARRTVSGGRLSAAACPLRVPKVVGTWVVLASGILSEGSSPEGGVLLSARRSLSFPVQAEAEPSVVLRVGGICCLASPPDLVGVNSDLRPS